jgi:acid phosphatase
MLHRNKRTISPLLVSLAARLAAGATSLYSTYSFNPLEHLAGIAPYFEPQDPPSSPAAPIGCTVTRAAYLVRHAAIYANDFDYEDSIEPFINKLKSHKDIEWSKIPTLNFLASWTVPFSDAELELLTRVGKLEAAQLGTSLSFRYPSLRIPGHIWASSAERTVKSAEALARGLEKDDDTVTVKVVDEVEEAGANSLTPYKSCPAYKSSTGSEQMHVFRDRFTKPILARLNAMAPGFGFNSSDVYGMMELCGYESVIRGSSPFCSTDLFTPDDWLAWEYSGDIQYHYNVGYGNPASGYIGLPWFEAIAGKLMADTAPQDLLVSFTHRELPPVVAVAMGLFNNSDFGIAPGKINESMPLDRINYRRAWKSSHLLPFLGNIAIERLNCSSPGFDSGDYYRVLVNSAPQELPVCNDGPGTSCSSAGFKGYVNERKALFNGFSEHCSVKYTNSTDTLSIYDSS